MPEASCLSFIEISNQGVFSREKSMLLNVVTTIWCWLHCVGDGPQSLVELEFTNVGAVRFKSVRQVSNNTQRGRLLLMLRFEL